MNVRAIATPQEFQERAGAFLEQREDENNAILGNLHRLLETGSVVGGSAGEAPFLCVAEDEGKVVAAAMRTPPSNLLLTRAPAVAVAVIADFAARQRIEFPGVFAPTESAQVFLTAWKKFSRRHVASLKPHRGQVCDRVIPPPAVAGRFDEARASDVELLTDWRVAFFEEIGEPERADQCRPAVESAVNEGRLFVWRNPEPVAMATSTGHTRHGVRVGFVYTPKELRGRHYATAITAALTQHLLDSGRRFCFLFTVSDNAVSNHIYAKLGYRTVADYLLVNFEAGAR